MSGRLAIGVGCRKGCPAEVLVALVKATCTGLDRTGARLFTIDRKRDEAGLREAARQLALPLGFFDAARLAAALPGVTRLSAHAAAVVGVPSVAEAAALAGAGLGAELLVPRQTSGGATCAVARGGGE